MSVSVKPLIQDLGKMSRDLEQKKQNLKTLEQDVNFVKDLKGRIYQDLQANDKLDWSDGSNRALLDRLYDQEGFQFQERLYCFDNAQEALSLLQEIDQFTSDRSNELHLQTNIISQKESSIGQYQQEILNIINKLSQCMSAVNH